MTLTVEAIYENGVLRPTQPLPLKEREKVQLSVRRVPGAADQSYGMIGWSGDADTFDRLLEESESDRMEKDRGVFCRGDLHNIVHGHRP